MSIRKGWSLILDADPFSRSRRVAETLSIPVIVPGKFALKHAEMTVELASRRARNPS